MSNEIVNKICPCCGQPLEYYQQQLDPRSKLVPKWIGTCKTPECDYYYVTIQDSNWTRLQTDEEYASGYRGMNKRVEAHS